jgi:hypothetical protein
MAEPLTEDELTGIISQEIAASLAYDKTDLSERRRRAIEYMRGEMSDWPAEKGRSSVVSRDTSDTISWILPGIIRLFTASGQMAICEPVEPSDEQWAETATDGINYVFWKDNEGYKILYDATYNSLLHGNGVVKHWWDDTPKEKVSFHSGLSDEQLQMLLTPEEQSTEEDGEPCETIELLAQETKQQTIIEPDPQTGQPVESNVPYHDVKIKRTTKYGCVKIVAVAPEDFLISAEATSIKGARLTGQKEQKTRSDLIEMGFDRDKVSRINRSQDDDATDIERRDGDRFDSAATEAMEEVTLYELYLRLDVDGDGIAELCQIFYAGEASGGTVLEWKVWEDEEVFSDIPCDPVPHRWDARSIFDKTVDVQEIKTVLSRQALDNLYATNNPQRFVTGRVLNPDELSNPSFGGTVFAEAEATVTPMSVPFVADKAFDGISYFDSVIEKRTGVSKQSMALDPEALQNQTATAAQLAHDAAYSQTELIARNQAELGWKSVFRAVLRLMVKHQDKPRAIRLTNKKWVEIDPRPWNADMDITIDTGLGTGSRDRDQIQLNGVKQDQIMLATAFREGQMIDKAVAMIPMLITTMKKSAEAAGIRATEMFYPEVSDEEVAAALKQIQEAAAKGSPEERMAQMEAQMKAQTDQANAQAQAQVEVAKTQAAAQVEQAKAQARAQVEAVQMQADMSVEDNKRKTEEYLAGVEARFKAMSDNAERQFQAHQKALDRKLQWDIANLKGQQAVAAAAAKPKPNGAPAS